jgi:hypothetical protein
VSVGGWKQIRLRLITRSSTCGSLRLRNFCFAPRYARYARAPPLNIALAAVAAVAAPCSIPVLSRFALVLALRARAGRLPRLRDAHADPITCAHAPMSFCINLGFNRSSPSGANAGGVVLSARLRAQRAHQCATTIADPITSAHCSNECLYQFGPRSA